MEVERKPMHFEIAWVVGIHIFSHCSTTAHEALGALESIFSLFPDAQKREMDDYMKILIDIKFGNREHFIEEPIRIYYREGEV